MAERPHIVTLPVSGDSINLAHVTRVAHAPTFTYLGFVGGAGNEYAIVGERDDDAFEAAWARFGAGTGQSEARRAEFDAIRERVIDAGMAIKRRRPGDMFSILEKLTGSLVRLVDIVEGDGGNR